MPSLQVRDFPPDLYEDLRSCAVKEDRSISQQTVYVLRQFLANYKASSNPENVNNQRTCSTVCDWPNVIRVTAKETSEERIARRKKIFERIDELPVTETPDGFPDAAEIVRQMRDERIEQIAANIGDIR